jgi:REP element-mobilizing transposase RayT
MILNTTGKIVHGEWIKSAEIRKEIEIHEYVIMPNHFHAIAEITTVVGAYGIRPATNAECPATNADNAPFDALVDDVADYGVGMENGVGVSHTPLRLRSPSKTVGALVRGFKSAVTTQLHQSGYGDSIWQRNYYEHIIRTDAEFARIAKYIRNNPISWEKDCFYVAHCPLS